MEDGSGKAVLALSAYSIVEAAVESGALWGYERARKHLDAGVEPTREQLVAAVAACVMNSLCEVVDFERSGVAAPVVRGGMLFAEDYEDA